MIASVAGSSGPASYGFENLVRIGAQSSGGGVRSGATKKPEDTSGERLTPAEMRQVDELRKTDGKVHRHEEAHLAVGRDLVIGGASYTYTTGPDNKRYAVAGEVSIDTSPAKTPEETIPKAEHIRETALAPSDPSAQDRSVAAQAARMAAEARIEVLVRQRAVAANERDGSGFYRGVQLTGANNLNLGQSLDLFA